MSLQKKVVVLFLAFMLIPMLFVGTLSFNNAKRHLRDSISTKLESISKLKAKEIEAFLEERRRDVLSSQSFESIRNHFPVLDRNFAYPESTGYSSAKDALDNHLKKFQALYGYEDIMLLDRQGVVKYASGDSHAITEPGAPLPEDIREAFDYGRGGVYFSDIYTGEFSGEAYLMMITAPLLYEDGSLMGVIAFEINMKSIYRLIQDRTGLGESGETLIAKKIHGGALFLNPLRHDAHAALQRKAPDRTDLPVIRAVNGETGTGVAMDYRGEEVISNWSHIPAIRWGMVSKIDTAEAFRPVDNLWRVLMVVGGVAMLAGSLIAFSVARSISHPILRLREGTQIIGEGNLDHKVGLETADEIGQLSRAFDEMTGKLKLALESLKESEEKFRHIANTIPGAVFQYKTSGESGLEFTYFSDKAREMYIDSADEWVRVPKKFIESVHPLDKKRVASAFMESVRARRPLDVVFRLVQPDSPPRWIHSVSAPSLPSGEETVWNGVAIDITERKLAEKERMRLATAIEQVAESVMITGRDGRIEYVNPAFERITGYTRGDVAGKDFDILADERRQESACKEIWSSMAHEAGWSGLFVSRKKDGSPLEEDMTMSPVFGQDGNVSNYVAVMRDVSHENMLNKARDHFTSITSHEMRHPLTKLRLAGTMLEGAAAGRGGREELAQIASALNESYDSLNRIVEATILISRLKLPQRKKSFSPVYLYATIMASVKVADSLAAKESRNIRIVANMDNFRKDVMVLADQEMISMALDEVISNAIKYTPDGRNVFITGKTEAGRSIVEVRDEGAGIPEDRREMVFEPYFSLEDTLSHTSGQYSFHGGGIGLGLTIAKMIMEYHEGGLEIGGPGEGGASVTFVFPNAGAA